MIAYNPQTRFLRTSMKPPLQTVPDGKLQVLLVDRDVDTLELYSTLIEHWGYKCELTTLGETAVLMAFVLRPDVIITSMTLPDMTGIDLALELRDDCATKNTKLILHTGLDSFLLGPEVQHTFDLVLQKPISVDALSDFLEECAL